MVADAMTTTRSLSTIPVDQRYYEDYVAGAVVDCGTIEVNEAEVLQFGQRFDPQPFHADAAAAADGPFRSVIASGWHTGSLMMRLFVQHYISSVASLGSPGAAELSWPRPVRPGDVLRVRVSVLEARRSRSKPDRGLVWSWIEVFNQRDEIVMTMKVLNVLACRNPEAPLA
jgi:acyl dehydratase